MDIQLVSSSLKKAQMKTTGFFNIGLTTLTYSLKTEFFINASYIVVGSSLTISAVSLTLSRPIL